MNFLAGYKTYLVAAAVILTAAYEALGPVLGLPGGGMVPDWVLNIEAALGLGAIRVAISTT